VKNQAKFSAGECEPTFRGAAQVPEICGELEQVHILEKLDFEKKAEFFTFPT
jgi:hypothetical protein